MSTPTAPTVPAVAITAWQAAIGAEQLAGYGYGAVGPRLSGGPHIALARTCELAHLALAATVQQLIAAPAPTDTAPPGNFQLPLVPSDDASAQQLAIRLEMACASAWRYVLAQLSEQLGSGADPVAAWTAATTALSASAVRAVQWRKLGNPDAASIAFPGV